MINLLIYKFQFNFILYICDYQHFYYYNWIIDSNIRKINLSTTLICETILPYDKAI